MESPPGTRPPGAAAPPTTETPKRPRTLLSALFVVAAIGGVTVAALEERHSFVDAYHRMGLGIVAASFACAVAGTTATFLCWDQVLRSYAIRLPLPTGARVFFVSQLGKYLPGSVWPALMQMEAGGRHGANRRLMLGANVTAILLGCCTGVLVACAILPWYDPEALRRYWWVLFAIPVLLALLHPRSLPWLLDLTFKLLRRPPLGQRLDPQHELGASAWSVLSWVAYGAQLGILAVGGTASAHGSSVFMLAIGGMALATTAGILFIPAPAGAGIREIILVLVLSSVMDTGSALAVALASRVVLMVSDIVLAGFGALAIKLRR